MKQAGPTVHEKLYPRALQRKVDAIAREEFAKFTFRVSDLASSNPMLLHATMPDMNTYFLGDEAKRQEQVDKMNALANSVNDSEIQLLAKRLEGLSNLKDRVVGIFDEVAATLVAMVPSSAPIAGVVALDHKSLVASDLEKLWATLLENEIIAGRNTSISVDGLTGARRPYVLQHASRQLIAAEDAAGELSTTTTIPGLDSWAFNEQLQRAQKAFFDRCRNISGLSAAQGVAG